MSKEVHPPTTRVKRTPIIEGDLAYIPLTKGYVAVIDAVDLPLVEGHLWCHATVGYAFRSAGKNDPSCSHIYLHRVILGLKSGDKRMGDHINGDKLDCRRANLRITTMAGNVQNRGARSDSSTGVKGVYLDKARGLWTAEVRGNGVRVRLGRFDSKEAAVVAVRAARERLHGEFARHE